MGMGGPERPGRRKPLAAPPGGKGFPWDERSRRAIRGLIRPLGPFRSVEMAEWKILNQDLELFDRGAIHIGGICRMRAGLHPSHANE